MTIAPGVARNAALCTVLAALASVGIAGAQPAPASASVPGGLSAHASSEVVPDPAPTAAAGTALLVDGRALAPLDAPPAVRRAIVAANKIRAKPYVWGGGHGHWWDRGYDCSGAVSFALRGGGFLTSPLASGPMESWGQPGPGRWITVYANASHAYAVIAGLRWDTAGNVSGTGPRWHEGTAAAASGTFVARHPAGY
jgi:cell wall-associated NlpC family hydrolase